jgi:hypothetical protein
MPYFAVEEVSRKNAVGTGAPASYATDIGPKNLQT